MDDYDPLEAAADAARAEWVSETALDRLREEVRALREENDRLRVDSERIEKLARFMVGQRGVGGMLYVFATPIIRSDRAPTADDLRAAIDELRE